MPKLKIRLLGTPLVQWEGQNLEIPRKASRALLYYLAAIGESVSRTKLSLLFWPDEPEPIVRRRLRDTLGQLRTSLPDADLVLSGNETLALDFSKVWVDISAFNNILDRLGHKPWLLPDEMSLPLHYYQSLKEAAALWRVADISLISEFTAFDHLDRWWGDRSHELQTSFVSVLTRLAKHERAIGELGSAIFRYRHALEINPYDEELHAHLLTALLGDGRSADALLHYEMVTKLFNDELGQTPSKRITSLYDRLYHEKLAIASEPLPEWPIRKSLHAPLTGRDEMLAELERHSRRNVATIVFGESGVGKTRLISEFYRRRSEEQRLLLAKCLSSEDSSPYYPWVDMLRQLVTHDEWLSLPVTWANILVTLIPELGDWREDLSPIRDEGLARLRTNIQEAIYQLLTVLVRKRPILLFVDDIHWADQSTLAVVSYLLEKGFFTPENGSLIMASRIEESNLALDDFLLNTPHTRLRKIQLERLEREDIRELTRYFLGQEVSDEFIDRLLVDTGGNPFFVLETLLEMLETGLPDEFDAQLLADLPLASNIHQLICRRWQRLSPEAINVLQTAAILGSSAATIVLEQAVECDPNDFAHILEEAERARLIMTVEQEGHLRYMFIHENNRDSLLQEMSRARKRLLHRRVALAMEKWRGGYARQYAAQLAMHFEEAEMLSKAFDYWMQAAEYAYRLASLSEATENFVHAERLIPHTPDLTKEQIYYLYSSWTDMAFGTDDLRTLERINNTLLEIGQERSSDLLIGAALDGLSDAAMAANKFSSGLEYTEQALPYLVRAGNTYELADALNHQGVFLYMLGQMSASQERFKRALALIPDTTNDPLLIRVRSQSNYQMSVTQELMGWPISGLEYAHRSLDDATRFQRVYDILVAYSVMGLGYYMSGNYTDGIDACTKGIELGELIKSWRILGYTHGYAALNACEVGDLGLAWEHAQAAIQIGQDHGHNEIVALGFRASGDVYRNLFDLASAINYYQQGAQVAGEHFTAVDNLIHLGFSLAMAGEVSGKTYLSQGIEKAYQFELSGIGLLGKFARLYICVLEQDFESLRELLPTAAQEARQRNMQTHILLADLFEAILKFQVGQVSDALDTMRSVASKAPSLPTRLLAYVSMVMGLTVIGLPVEESLTQVKQDVVQLKASLGDAPVEEAWQQFLTVLKTQLGGQFEITV